MSRLAGSHDLAELRDLGVELATDASALLMARISDGRSFVDTKTSATDMVTEIDRQSEDLIVAGLRRARPDDAILGEEGAAHDGTTGVRWVIDPLDGTTNYLYGYPAFAVSIAAEIDGRVAVGVVADPSRDEIFTACRGGGALLNGAPIRATTAADLATSLVATGFGYQADQRARQAEVLTSVLPAVRDVRRNGSAALDMCWVACGRIDGYYEEGIQYWDVAAGAVIATEAGACVEGMQEVASGERSMILAAGTELAAPLRALVQAAARPRQATR